VATTVTVQISVGLASGNATEEELRDIIFTLIDEIDDDLQINSISVGVMDDNLGYIWSFDIVANSEAIANLVADTIESDAFKNDLVEEIEANTNSEVADIALTASIDNGSDNGDDTDDDESIWSIDRWLDPFSYERLQWIIVGALASILCICCLFCCRCYFVCCRGKEKHKKNGYEAGNALFNSARPSSMDAATDADFQSDLKNAIEMNNRGKLLKTSAGNGGGGGAGVSLQDVDVDDVAVAFDMNFDEKKKDKKEEVNAKTSLLDKKNGNGKKSEGDEETAGGHYVTPGGPDDDDEDNPPPAPAPPKDLQNMDEYDLL